MKGICEDYIMKISERIAEDNELLEWQLIQEKFESVAQNYFGVLIPVKLTGKTNNGDDFSLSLVLKLAPTDERYRVSGAITLFFEREIFVYSKILQLYQDFQLNFTSKFEMPKCHFFRNTYCNEALVLDNLCTLNYKPYSGGTFLDVHHMVESLKSLSKFHALSFIMKEKCGKEFKLAEEKCVPLNEQNNKRFMEILDDRLMKAILKFEGTRYILLLQKLKDKYIKLVEAIATEVNSTAICHGDIWKENILYKYENNKLVSACLIDYQTVRMSSPAYDVLYLIISSSDQTLRKTNFTNLLDTYYKEFDNFLQEAGIQANSVYSRNDFENDLRVVAPACLIIANTALWLFNGLQEEGHVKSKKVLTTDEERAVAVNTYMTTVSNIIDDFESHGYLSSLDWE